MEGNKIPEFNKSQNAPRQKGAVDFIIGFFGVIVFIFFIERIIFFLPIHAPFIPLILAPIIILISLVHFFRQRRWIFWGMIASLIIVGGVFAYFISQIKFG